MAPMAPPLCALFSLASKVQPPRRIAAIWPVAVPAGSGAQAVPVLSTLLTSKTVAEMGPLGGPLPGNAKYGAPPATDTLPAKNRSFWMAPAEITEGSEPKFPRVFRFGPLLAAETTATTPNRVIRSNARDSRELGDS